MTAYVVDASAAVEYLLRTAAGRALAELIDRADLYAPELLDVEVVAALRRASMHHGLPAERAATAVEDLRTWPLERITHRDLGATAWALRHNFTAYDAFYVAAARQLGAALVTADGPLARAPGAGVPVHDVTTR